MASVVGEIEPKIFVGGLPKDCDEVTIANYFSAFGVVSHVEVKRDVISGVTRGFAFVTFESWETYGKVLATYTEHQLEGKWIEVKQAMPQDKGQGKGESKGDGKGVVMPKPSTSKGMYQTGKAGSKGKSVSGTHSMPGLAHPVVRPSSFTNGTAATKDIGSSFGNRVATRTISAATIVPAPTKHAYNAAKIFVGGLPKAVDENEVSALAGELTGYFSAFGAVERVDMKTDAFTGQSRGFCFITFEDEAPVQHILDTYDSHQLRGKWIEVKRAVPDSEPSIGHRPSFGVGPSVNPAMGYASGFGPTSFATGFASSPTKGFAKGFSSQSNSYANNAWANPADMEDYDVIHETMKVFVGHLPKNCDEEMLRCFASNFGRVEQVLIKRDLNTGQTRGFGFVSFDSAAAVSKMLASHESNNINGQWVDVKVATAEGTKGCKGIGKGGDSGCGYGPWAGNLMGVGPMYQPY